MDLLKFFIKDEVPAVGLSKFKERRVQYYNNQYEQPNLRLNRPVFKPNYSNNFFLL